MNSCVVVDNGAYDVPNDDPLSEVIDVDADAVFTAGGEDDFIRPGEDVYFYKVA